MSSLSFIVPDGTNPGDTVTITVNGNPIQVVIPEAALAGTELQLNIPNSNQNSTPPTPTMERVYEDESDGPSYTSGEEDEGPAVMSPKEYVHNYTTMRTSNMKSTFCH